MGAKRIIKEFNDEGWDYKRRNGGGQGTNDFCFFFREWNFFEHPPTRLIIDENIRPCNVLPPLSMLLSSSLIEVSYWRVSQFVLDSSHA